MKIIRSFLESEILEDGAFQETPVGSPQGGVISPLLMNIYLDRFDKEMMEKGIRIVRYADDILIFAKCKSEAGRYRSLATKILQEELKLAVNEKKTHITNAGEGVPYLGFIIRRNYISIHPKRIKRFKDKIRMLTPRNTGRNVEAIVQRLNPALRGWSNYFRIANCKETFKNISAWVRRRLRMRKLKLYLMQKGQCAIKTRPGVSI